MRGTFAAMAVMVVVCVASVAEAEDIVASWAVVSVGDTAEDRLYVFDSATPGNSSYVVVTGLQDAYQVIHDIDFNPANGQLYGVACHTGVPEFACGLYTLDPVSGAASLVGGFTSPTGYHNYIDFDPVGGEIRVLSLFGHNYRLNPSTGGVAGNDTGATWAAGDPNFGTQISTSGLAYTNSVSGATQTTAYVVDLNEKNLLRLGGVNGAPDTPAGGLLHTIGSLNLAAGSNGFAYGFDISPTTGTAYAGIGFGGTYLYTVDLSTGAATSVGEIGGVGGAMTALAVSPSPITAASDVPALGSWGLAGLAGLVVLTGVALLLVRGRLLP